MKDDTFEMFGQPLTQKWPWKTTIEVDSLSDELALNAWLICEQATSLGVNNLKVEFKGQWDSKDELEIDHDAPNDVLGRMIAYYLPVDPGSWEIELRELTLQSALEKFADAFAEEHHKGYEIGSGGGAELLFDLQTRYVDGKLHERREIQGEDVEIGRLTTSPLEGLSDSELQMAIADAGASYASRHQYQAVNHRMLIAALKRLGTVSVKSVYSGSGDDGCVDSAEYHAGGEQEGLVSIAHEPDLTTIVAQFDHRGYPVPVSLGEAVNSMMQDEISRLHSGYEDGEGGNGHVTLDVVNAEISWVGYNAGECDYETDVTGSIAILGQQPAAASAPRP